MIAPTASHAGQAGWRHWERTFPNFKPEQLFALVADVESYPIFMPGWVDARILERGERVWRVENVFGFGPVRSRFVSTTKLDPPHRIDISARDGPLRDFQVWWKFQPCGKGSRVSCASYIEFRSPLLDALARISRSEVEQRTIAAFEARAKVLFGNHRHRHPHA